MILENAGSSFLNYPKQIDRDATELLDSSSIIEYKMFSLSLLQYGATFLSAFAK